MVFTSRLTGQKPQCSSGYCNLLVGLVLLTIKLLVPEYFSYKTVIVDHFKGSQVRMLFQDVKFQTFAILESNYNFKLFNLA